MSAIHILYFEVCLDRLPDDLVREIFLHHSLRLPASAEVLAAVSKLWRAIAFSIPELWSTIMPDIPNRNPSPPRLERWLERSSDDPLFVIIDATGKNVSTQENEYIRRIILSLTPFVPRWRYLKLVISDAHEEGFHGFPLLANASQLKTIIIDFLSTNESIISSIASATHVKALKLSSLSPVPIGAVMPTFPWKTLSYLNLSANRSWDSMLHVLKHCTSISNLALSASTPLSPTADPLPRSIQLPLLKTLHVKSRSIDALKAVSLLNCPNLVIFHMNLDVLERESQENDYERSLFGLLEFIMMHERHSIVIFKFETNRPLPLHWIIPFHTASRSSNIVLLELVIPSEGWFSAVHASVVDGLKHSSSQHYVYSKAPFHVIDDEADDGNGVLRMGWLDKVNIRSFQRKAWVDPDLTRGMTLSPPPVDPCPEFLEERASSIGHLPVELLRLSIQDLFFRPHLKRLQLLANVDALSQSHYRNYGTSSFVKLPPETPPLFVSRCGWRDLGINSLHRTCTAGGF
ncbi:hypothetical protein AN958_05940 [Leucoagaricus sp. SymC.cos]|nr:hypothetical protein AN958_05940 [Leucoagaricus sp. SymC.cos]